MRTKSSQIGLALIGILALAAGLGMATWAVDQASHTRLVAGLLSAPAAEKPSVEACAVLLKS